MEGNVVRYGVIGVGGHGVGRHIIPLTKLPNVVLVAVADIDKNRCEDVASRFKTKCYTDYHDMIDREVLDAVSIVTPTGLHAKIAIDVLRKGVNVLVDKPLGANINEVAEVVKTAKYMKKKLMVGYWSRFSPALRYAKEVVDKGLLGEPYVAYGYLVRRRGIPGKPTFIDKVLSGGKGALLDIGCYMIDNMLTILRFRKPITVSGAVYTKFGRNPDEIKFNWGSWDPAKFDLEDYAIGFVRLEGGVSMVIEVGWAANVSHVGEMGYMRILGDRGGIEGRGDEAIREISFHSRTENFLIDTKPVLPNVDMAYEMVKNFIESILMNREPMVTGYESLVLHTIIDGIYHSAELGKEISVSVPEV